MIAVVFLVRELLQVVRSYLVENTCTRIEKAMTVLAISHLLKTELTALSEDKIGALQGRISRSIVGFVRFIRLAFLDFLPPVVTGIFALIAVVCKQPLVAFVMALVVPISVYLTLRQLTSQKGVRLALIRSREEMDIRPAGDRQISRHPAAGFTHGHASKPPFAQMPVGHVSQKGMTDASHRPR